MRSYLITTIIILFTIVEVQVQCFISKNIPYSDENGFLLEEEETIKPLPNMFKHTISTPIEVWYGIHNEKVTNKEFSEESEFNNIEKIKTATIATIVKDPEGLMDDGIVVEDYDDDTDLDDKPVQPVNDGAAMKNYKRGRQQIKERYNVFPVINEAAKMSQLFNNAFETEANDDTSKARLKRSTNVVEEENLGTTISGFKFTGRPTHLHHNLAFKNINS